MSHTEFDVAVSGGDLRVCHWPGAGPTVIGIHGITSNALAFGPLAAAGDFSLYAPDLRGRAGSSGLPGPFGLVTHTDDLMLLLDHLGLERAILVGHSMGAFVAMLAASRYPDRIASVLLVDGGVPLAIPPGTDLEAVIGPAMRRLSMTFPTRQSYVDFWQAHPAFAGHWSPLIEEHILRDLIGDRSSCNVDAIRADGRDVLDFPELSCQVSMLWAERGMLDEPQGLYGSPPLDGAVRVDDVNHYTILLAPQGASVVAAHLRRLVPV